LLQSLLFNFRLFLQILNFSFLLTKFLIRICLIIGNTAVRLIGIRWTVCRITIFSGIRWVLSFIWWQSLIVIRCSISILSSLIRFRPILRRRRRGIDHFCSIHLCGIALIFGRSGIRVILCFISIVCLICFRSICLSVITWCSIPWFTWSLIWLWWRIRILTIIVGFILSRWIIWLYLFWFIVRLSLIVGRNVSSLVFSLSISIFCLVGSFCLSTILRFCIILSLSVVLLRAITWNSWFLHRSWWKSFNANPSVDSYLALNKFWWFKHDPPLLTLENLFDRVYLGMVEGRDRCRTVRRSRCHINDLYFSVNSFLDLNVQIVILVRLSGIGTYMLYVQFTYRPLTHLHVIKILWKHIKIIRFFTPQLCLITNRTKISVNWAWKKL